MLALSAALAGCSFTGAVDRPAEARTAPSTASPPAGEVAAAAAPSAATAGTASRAPLPSTAARTAARGAGGTGTAAGSGTGVPVGPVDRCRTSELSGSLVAGSPGAGQRYATLVLRDTGGRTCTVDGYGGLGLVDAAGHPLPTLQVRVPSPAPRAVVLGPGDAVSAALHWSAVAAAGDRPQGDCQPVAAALQVIPPDETGALSVPWSGGPVCGSGRIDQQAYAAD